MQLISAFFSMQLGPFRLRINQPIPQLGESMTEMTDLPHRLRDLIETSGYRYNERIPPERELCEKLGTTRNQLRKALAELEAQGRIWRHVGRGTFVGARPVLNLQDITYLGDQIKPEHVLAVRFNIEPELSRLAACHARKTDCEQMLLCAEKCREAEDWRSYEAWDNNLHHAISRATRTQLFIYFFETLTSVRRSIVWGLPRETSRPTADYSSFREHDEIVAAIVAGDGDLAAKAMRRPLQSVYSRVLPDCALLRR
jgi:DNA-binding FadR family transcriptional regulator